MGLNNISPIPLKIDLNTIGIVDEKRKGMFRLKKEYHIIKINNDHDVKDKAIRNAIKSHTLVSIAISQDGLAKIKVHGDINDKLRNAKVVIVDTLGNELQTVNEDDVETLTEEEVNQLAQYFFKVFIEQKEAAQMAKLGQNNPSVTETTRTHTAPRKARGEEKQPTKNKESDAEIAAPKKREAAKRTADQLSKDQAHRNKEFKKLRKEMQATRERADEDKVELKKQTERLEQRDYNAS